MKKIQKTRLIVSTVVFLMLISLLSSCACKEKILKIETDSGKDVLVQTCCPIVEYSKYSFTIKGVKIPISKVPVEIGEVTWKPEILHSAHTITQALDIGRMCNCALLLTYASIDRQKLIEVLDKMQKCNFALEQLALLVALNNPDAVIEWIKKYGPLAAGQVETASNSPGLGKALKTMKLTSLEWAMIVYHNKNFEGDPNTEELGFAAFFSKEEKRDM